MKTGILFEKAGFIAYSFSNSGWVSTIIAKTFLMTIREIAKHLYRLQQEVKTLEKKLEDAPLETQVEIEQQLRKAKANRERMRRILNGQLDR